MGSLYLDQFGKLLNLGQSGQIEIRQVVSDYIERVTRESDGHLRFYPLVRGYNYSDADSVPKLVVISPRISYGRPVTERNGISTRVIAARFRTGETIAELVEDYDLTNEHVEEAVRFEQFAAAA